MIICNCLCWSLYSFVIHNHWTFWPNLGGILLGEYYTMVLLSSKLSPKQFKLSAITLIGFTFLNIAGAAASFIFLKDNYEAAKNCMGVITIIVLCAMYVSPLTSMREVIMTRDSSSLNPLLTIASFINGFLWVVYGFFFNDFYVWFPNGMGVVSAAIQFALFIIFHRSSRRNSQELPIYDGESSPKSELSSPTSVSP
jgi:solute carrier family 50 protein (sugar transporter)